MRTNTMRAPGPAGPFVHAPSGTFVRSVGSPTTRCSSTPSPAAWDVRRWSPEQVRDGRRRHLVGALVLAAAIAIAVALAMLAGSGAVPAAAAGAAPAAASGPLQSPADGPVEGSTDGAAPSLATSTHVVRAGDTMWAIAHRYRGQVAHDTYLAALLERNGGADLRVGQVLALP